MKVQDLQQFFVINNNLILHILTQLSLLSLLFLLPLSLSLFLLPLLPSYHCCVEGMAERVKEADLTRSTAVSSWTAAGIAYHELAEEAVSLGKKSEVWYGNAADCFQRALRWGVTAPDFHSTQVLPPIESRVGLSDAPGSECRILLW